MSELTPAPRRKEFTPSLASEARHGLDYFELIKKTKDCGYALSVSSSELEVREERVRLGLSAYRAGIVSTEARIRICPACLSRSLSVRPVHPHHESVPRLNILLVSLCSSNL